MLTRVCGFFMLISFVVLLGCSQGEKADCQYPITVDYNISLSQMLERGHYDKINQQILPAFFPFKGNGLVNTTCKIVKIDGDSRVIDNSDVLKYFDALNLRAATLPELLAFAATYGNRWFLGNKGVIALGSPGIIANGDTVSVYLYSRGSCNPFTFQQAQCLQKGNIQCNCSPTGGPGRDQFPCLSLRIFTFQETVGATKGAV